MKIVECVVYINGYIHINIHLYEKTLVYSCSDLTKVRRELGYKFLFKKE